MNVLLTRTSPFSASTTETCRQQGIHIIHYPLIDVKPTPHQRSLQNAAAHLAQYDIAIFVSKWAAHYGMQAINAHFIQLNYYPKIDWAAIGAGTAQTLQMGNLFKAPLPILVPESPPYDSESFLSLAKFQTETIQNKKVIIFRGNNGRDLIPYTLEKRGAKLTLVETYIRQPPCFKTGLTLLKQIANFPQLIIISSAYALNNLVILFSSDNNTMREGKIQPYVWEIPMIVVGKRLLKIAKQLGFTHVIPAVAADDQTLKDVIRENFCI